MVSELAEHHDELRMVARRLVSASPSADAEGHARASWEAMVDAGWLGLEVPADLNGSGATFGEVAVVLEEMGRAATAGPYLGPAVLTVGALNLIEPGVERDDLLRQVAGGRLRCAVALPTGDPGLSPSPAPFRVARTGRMARVDGQARFVPDAAGADHFLVSAENQDQTPVLVLVDAKDPRLSVVEQQVLDSTRRFAYLQAVQVEVPENAVFNLIEPDTAQQRLFDRGATATACDSLGLAEAMVESTTDYACERKQFDRPIGSFQAVKHACADMFVRLQVARHLAAAAVSAATTGDPDGAPAISMAKAYLSDAAVDICGKALQLHGGFGYTWDSGIHVYLKRALLNRSLFGSPASHRQRLARRYPGSP